MKRKIGVTLFVFAVCFASFGLYHGVTSLQAQERYDLDLAIDWKEPCEDLAGRLVLADDRIMLLFMELEGADPITVSVLDAEGNTIYVEEGDLIRKQTEMEVSAGLYVVQIEFHGQASASAKVKASCIPK